MLYSNAQKNSRQHSKTYSSVKPVSNKHSDSIKSVLQTKLKIGQADDKYEQEADRVAEQVMRIPEPQLASLSGKTSLSNITYPQQHTVVQRSCSTCHKEKKLIQKKTRPASAPEITTSINSSIHSLQGSGKKLSQPERNFFEPRFGTDFQCTGA